MTFEIETGIEIPEPLLGSGQRKYPFPDMGPGESFFVPARDPDERRRLAKIIMIAARRWARRQPAPHPRFTSRQVEGGARCWRLS